MLHRQEVLQTPLSPPDVSVLMSVWNGEAFLAEAIQSVLAQQTASTWELIIVDDGSTDASAAIAQHFTKEDARISLLWHNNRANLGISASRNLAMSRARGDLLAFLDADDVWLPYRLAHQITRLRAHPTAAMIYGQAERWWDPAIPFDECLKCNGNNFTPPLLPEGEQCGLLHGATLLRWFLADESLTPCTCSVLVRSAVARRLGGFDDSFRGMYDDQVFYAKVALAEPVLVDDRCVARYRRHAGSCCWRAGADTTNSMARQTFLQWLSDYVMSQGDPIDLENIVMRRTQPSSNALADVSGDSSATL